MKEFFSKLGVNVPVRFKNWTFWFGLGAAILAAMDVSPEMFTNWSLVWQELISLVNNPFKLGCVIVAIIGVFNDPTTSGLKDSAQALTYSVPRK